VQPALPGQARRSSAGRRRLIYESEAETVLAPAAQGARESGIAVETHATAGHAAVRIAQIADDLKADLIVLARTATPSSRACCSAR